MKPLIFIPTEEQEKIAILKSKEVIDILSDQPIEMKAYILQQLILSFEDVSGIDLRNSVDVSMKK